MEPTKKDIESPLFKAIWAACKEWDLQRKPGDGYAAFNGTDAMTIIGAVAEAIAKERERCARIAEDCMVKGEDDNGSEFITCTEDIAAAIRRGDGQQTIYGVGK